MAFPSFRRRGKYNAKKTTLIGVDGKFDSKGEAGRYGDLRLRLLAGEIRYLERQVSFDLAVNGILICRYIADFTYEEMVPMPSGPAWFTVVEGFKGYKTPEFRMKEKLMLACHGIVVRVSGQRRPAKRKRT